MRKPQPSSHSFHDNHDVNDDNKLLSLEVTVSVTKDSVTVTSLSLDWKSAHNEETQTTECMHEEKETQAVMSASIETQTDAETHNLSGSSEVDYDKLAAFLRRVGPAVLTELDKIEQSRAFDRSDYSSDDLEGGAKVLFTLQTMSETVPHKIKVSSVSWTCSGNVLAVGLCCLEHENWCDHRGQVIFYNVNRQNLSPNSPSQTLETSSCVTQVCAHPAEPSIVAVGMFSGEVLVWNLQKDDDCILGTSVNIPGCHKDAVSQVSWVVNPDPTKQGLMLVTAGRDGQILVWQVASVTGIFRLSNGFGISLEHGAHGRKVRTPMGDGLDNELGVTCFSFATNERSTFIVGLEGGGLLHCSMLANKPVSVRSDIPLNDPVLSSYEGHLGTVLSVQCSTSKETFVSCGMDKEIHIYQFNQLSPVKTIFSDTVYVGVAWYPTNASIFSAWGEAGVVEFYSQHKGEAIPSLRLSAHKENPPIAATQFNHSCQLLASGDLQGKVVIWKMPSLYAPST